MGRAKDKLGIDGEMRTSLRKWQKRLSSRIASIPEPVQRTVLFSEEIASLDAPAAASVLRHIIVENFSHRDAPSRLTAEAAMVSLLEQRWSPKHRDKALQWAVKKGDRLVSIFLGHVGPGNQEDEHIFEVPNYSGDRPITLGERRSLATEPNRNRIALALRDPHPMVIEKLLENPKLTEKDAVFMSSRRPAPWAALTKIATHPKYRTRRPIARALIQNPYLPVPVALTLLTCLDVPTIETLAKDPKTNPLLKETAQQALRALNG